MWLGGLEERYPGRFISEILAEINRLPVGLMEEVGEARAYRQAFEMRKAAEQSDNATEAIERLPQDGLFPLVPEIDFAIAAVEREKREKGVA